MNYLVTGAAGFIGSHMVENLLADGHRVVGYDNLSTGCEKFLAAVSQHPNFTLVRGDLLKFETLAEAMNGCERVIHFAANADVRYGLKHPHKDLEQNVIATYHVLEAMKRNNVRQIVFSSTGSIYGECPVIPTPEDAPLPIQTSLYGASKLASEGLIEAYCEGFGIQAWIFRFVSILGERYTHGHVFDFYKKLKENPNELLVLGDGHQKKSYLYVQDCLAAIRTALESATERVNIFNLGTSEYCEVNDSVHWICEYLGLTPQLHYSGGKRGWVGDNPFIFLKTDKICAMGWKPRLNIREAVIKTVEYLRQNEWVLERC